MDVLPYWKRVWQTVSSISDTISENDVTSVLQVVKDDLVLGLSKYIAYSEESLILWRNVVKTSDNSKLHTLIRRIAKSINLDVQLTWQLFRNFLMFVYHGKVEDAHKFVNTEMQLVNFLESFKQFYSMERIYCLKILHHILNNCDNKNNKYHICYADFITDVNINKIRASLIQQLGKLHEEIIKHTDQESLIVITANEIKEVCLLLVASAKMLRCRDIEMEQFVQLVQLCDSRNYGFNHLLAKISDVMVDNLINVHIAVVLVPFAKLWNSFELFKPHRKILENIFALNNFNTTRKNILILHWALIQTANPNKTEMVLNFKQKYERTILNTLQLHVLEDLATFCDSKFILTLAEANEIQSSIYKTMQQLFARIDVDDGFWYEMGAMHVLVALLKDKNIATKIFSDISSDFSQILKLSELMFPYDFISFSVAIKAELQHDDKLRQQALAKLNNLTFFAKSKLYQNFTLVTNDFVEHFSFGDQNIFVFQTTGYSYIDILQHMIICLLSDEASIYSEAKILENIKTGLILLVDVFECDITFADEKVASNLLDQIFRLMVNYLTSDKYNHAIVMCCLRLCAKMIPISPEKILYYFNLHHIFPVIITIEQTNNNPTDLQDYILEDTLVTILENDLLSDLQNLVPFTINMIQNGIICEENYTKIHLPLLAFLLQKLFPIFTLSWRNCRDYDGKVASIISILELVLHILTEEFHSQCYEMVLTNQSFIQAFFIIFGNMKSALDQSVLLQSNWESDKNLLVQLSSVCINLVLLLIKKTAGTNELSKYPFGISFCLTNIKSINNIKALAGLINYSFEPKLSELSCRLLIKFVQNPSIPILAHLDMDGDQIRAMFLEKLRDPLESNAIKVAIIDLISASITAQNGLTATFFNIPKWNDNELSDNISNFVVEFLKNIKKTPECLSTPLQASVLNLIHQLWQENNANLKKSLTDITNFWVYLTQPLSVQFKLPNSIYCKIMNVLSIELTKSSGEDNKYNADFNLVIDNLFKSNFIIKMLQHNINYLRDNTSDLQLMYSTRNLLVIFIIKKSNLFKDNYIRCEIAVSCLKGLLEHLKDPYQSEVIDIWSGIYLYIITEWEHTCFTNFEVDLYLLIDIFKCFSCYYQSATKLYQEKLITISCKIIQILKKQIGSSFEPGLFKSFLDVMYTIIDKEQALFFIQNNVADNTNWILLIIFINHLLDLDWISKYQSWFYDSNTIWYVLKTVCHYINKPETLPIAKIAMQTLVKYAKTDMYLNISVSDLELFYYDINPSSQFLNVASFNFKTNSQWPFEAFWSTYTGLIQLNTVLLKKSPCRYLGCCFTFFSMHWVAIESLLMLPSCTMELTALGLVQSILDLGYELLRFKEEWHRNQMFQITLTQFFEMVNRCMNCCIEIMMAPNILKFFSYDNMELISTEDIPCNNFIQIINRVFQIVITSCLCYNEISPSLITLMNPVINIEIPNVVILESNFAIPQINKGIKSRLSYGNLLCLVEILCNVLNQLPERNYSAKTASDVSSTSTQSNMSINRTINEQDVFCKAPNEITIDENIYSDDILVFVCPNFVQDPSTIKHKVDLDFSASWLVYLNYECTSTALELLGTYLASQVFLLESSQKSTADDNYYFCCIGTELLIFQEYIKKKYRNKTEKRISTQIRHPGQRVQYIMAPSERLQINKVDASDSDDSSSESSTWGIAPDVNPIFPEAFIAWRDSEINDNYIKPCFPEFELVQKMVSEEFYLLMISHWFKDICKLND